MLTEKKETAKYQFGCNNRERGN